MPSICGNDISLFVWGFNVPFTSEVISRWNNLVNSDLISCYCMYMRQIIFKGHRKHSTSTQANLRDGIQTNFAKGTKHSEILHILRLKRFK